MGARYSFQIEISYDEKDYIEKLFNTLYPDIISEGWRIDIFENKLVIEVSGEYSISQVKGIINGLFRQINLASNILLEKF